MKRTLSLALCLILSLALLAGCDSITKTTVGGKDGYGVAVVQAKYENAAVTFTLSYTPEGKLGGLFFK